ncbi:MAG TPA: TlpA disulfide reductase family protein [Flavisolibacter sp.]|jgi:thiol-disulfide isomerase/thioredoxin|nr:TlpA disulfide reductase family protein [Flavisolibacter sp.]
MRSIIVLALLCPALSWAQPTKNNGSHRPLTVGDTLPSGALNPKFQTPNAKLLILDFWATWCTACLKAFPRLDSLRRQYNGDLQVLLVNSLSTGDKGQKAAAYFKKWKARHGRTFPFPSLVEDTVLTQLFPFSTIPHYVWLDEKLRVLAITGSEELTAANITAALENRPLQVRTKADVRNYDEARPLLVGGNGGGGEALRFHTLISGYIQGLPTGTRKQQTPDGRYTKLTYTNRSVLNLYRIAYGNSFPANRVVLEVPDTTRLTKSTDWGHWKYNNTFCYEILTPPLTLEKALARMQSDLVSFFGYTAAVETRALDTWVLEGTGSPFSPSPKPRGTKEAPQSTTGQPLAALIRELDFRLPFPVSNECTGAQAMTLSLPPDLTDIKKINDHLRPYNLRFTRQKRPWPVFVIRGPGNPSQ